MKTTHKLTLKQEYKTANETKRINLSHIQLKRDHFVNIGLDTYIIIDNELYPVFELLERKEIIK